KAAPVRPAVEPPAPAGERATITVKLPADAALFVDDRRSPSKDPVRSFSTPPLPAGREFAYVIRAEVVRNGQPETLTQKVPFKAGERVVVDFTSLGK
ncbi:MAG: TIGR03000 domain-containing protein, partial [Planctomycetes bacterium]|nr:TIGR03000 domain-containing protein [Planctomycetota bacterium]